MSRSIRLTELLNSGSILTYCLYLGASNGEILLVRCSMKKRLLIALVALPLLVPAIPIDGDNCYECFGGDLCIPVALGWGFDSCSTSTRRVVCSFDFTRWVPIYCNRTVCSLGPMCTIDEVDPLDP